MPIRPEWRQYYRGASWQAARADILTRSGNACERCGRRQGESVLCQGEVWFCSIWNRWRAPGSILVDLRPAIERGVFVPRPCGDVYVVSVQLGVAHIDANPGNSDPSNLAGWCRTCHLWHDAGFHRQTRQRNKDLARPLFSLQIPQIDPFG